MVCSLLWRIKRSTRAVPLRACLMRSQCPPLRPTFLPAPPARTAHPPRSTRLLSPRLLLPHPARLCRYPLPPFCPTLLDHAAFPWAPCRGTWERKLFGKLNGSRPSSRERPTTGARRVGGSWCQKVVPQKRSDADCSAGDTLEALVNSTKLCRSRRAANGEHAGMRVAVHVKRYVARGQDVVINCSGNPSDGGDGGPRRCAPAAALECQVECQMALGKDGAAEVVRTGRKSDVRRRPQVFQVAKPRTVTLPCHVFAKGESWF